MRVNQHASQLRVLSLALATKKGCEWVDKGCVCTYAGVVRIHVLALCMKRRLPSVVHVCRY
jgi:hypothetical protein